VTTAQGHRSHRSAAATTRRGAVRAPLLARPLASYYLVLGSGLLLVGLGLAMVLSASMVDSLTRSGSSFTQFHRQLMWVCIAVPPMWVAVHMPVRFFRLLAYPLLLLSTALLVLVLVPGLGIEVEGATRWLAVGPVSIQPSELAKLSLALWGADLYTRKAKLLHDWKHVVIPLLPVASLLALLIMLEPDMGTTLALLCVVVGLLWVVGTPLRLFGVFFAGLVGILTWVAMVAPYRLLRITAWLHPEDYETAAAWQAIQGKIAVAQGGWFGLGLGASRQKWGALPNSQTDFIFAIIGEELGLVGTLVVLLLFGLLGYAGVRIAMRSTDPFCRYAAAAVTCWIVGQAVINIGVVIGLLPVTGIPLPLISFGGSSLVSTLFAIGMLAAFARHEPGAAAALAARRPGPARRVGRWAVRYYGFGPAPSGPAVRRRTRTARGGAA
jgi:cell division protein FtsW